MFLILIRKAHEIADQQLSSPTLYVWSYLPSLYLLERLVKNIRCLKQCNSLPFLTKNAAMQSTHFFFTYIYSVKICIRSIEATKKGAFFRKKKESHGDRHFFKNVSSLF